VAGATASRARRPARAPADKVLDALRRLLPDDVTIDGDAATVVVHAFKNAQIEDARRRLDVILREMDVTAGVAVAHRARSGHEWVLTEPRYRAPRTRHAGRRRGDEEAGGPLLSPRAKVRWLAAFLVAAPAGAVYYAVSPGVASYQIGFTLTLPLIAVVLFWLHRRLPTRLQWALAITLALVGPTGYLIYGGSQW
jgi:hypothetical protein